VILDTNGLSAMADGDQKLQPILMDAAELPHVRRIGW
jgi:hypothetical protein